MARAQEKMIGVGQDDVRIQLAGQIALRDALDRGLRANRHEDRRFDDAMGGVNQAGARAGVGTGRLQFKAHLLTVSVRGGISVDTHSSCELAIVRVAAKMV